MATYEATFVQDNTAPDIAAQLTDENNLPIDLTDVTEVRFQMRKPDDVMFTVNRVAEIDDRPTGLVSYSWQPNDLGVDGLYDVQWEIHWSDGKIQTQATANRILVRRK